MHSDLEQAQRETVMHEFKAGRINILVATDIVARGIDIDDIRLVINFDVPHDSEDYVHRIGRTARANNDGVALTFISEKEQSNFKSIENFLKKRFIKFLFLKNWEKLRNTNRVLFSKGKGGNYKKKISGEKGIIITEEREITVRLPPDKIKARLFNPALYDLNVWCFFIWMK